MTDFAREKVIVRNRIFGSLNTYVTDKGVSAALSGYSTIFIDFVSP